MICPLAAAKPSFLAAETPGCFWVMTRQPADLQIFGVESVLLSRATTSKSLKVWCLSASMQGEIYFSSLKVGTTTVTAGVAT